MRLERRPASAQGIVVLSGGVFYPDELHAELPESTLIRCLHAAELYRKGQSCPILVSGGRDEITLAPTGAQAMADFLELLGVRAEDIIVEGKARSTYENAVESARELKARGLQRIVLVTEAYHMARSELCFRKQGIEVVTSVCNYPVTRHPFSVIQLLPSPTGPRETQAAFHEWLGLAWYWVTGKI